MHTEAEAAKLWCPMARTTHYNSARNRTDEGAPALACMCISSKCAMWRWCSGIHEVRTSEKPIEGWEHFCADDEGNPEYWVEPHDEWKARREGYCGMTGPGLR